VIEQTTQRGVNAFADPEAIGMSEDPRFVALNALTAETLDKRDGLSLIVSCRIYRVLEHLFEELVGFITENNITDQGWLEAVESERLSRQAKRR
jgi:hypothetical protein